MPYATPYRQNSVTLSDTGNSSGAEIVGNIANSVPYAGAVNYLRFETDRRRPYTLRAFKRGNKPCHLVRRWRIKVGMPLASSGRPASCIYGLNSSQRRWKSG